MTRRPRPKIVTLSDAAAARVQEIMAASSKPYLRVGVNNGNYPSSRERINNFVGFYHFSRWQV